MIAFLLKYKDIITTVAGFTAALSKVVLDYLNTGTYTVEGLLMALGLFVIGWFTGKTVPAAK